MKKRIISTLLAMLMMLSAFVALIPISASGAEEVVVKTPSHELATTAALTQQYASALDKIQKDEFMELYLTSAGHRIYCNPYTGEVIYLNLTTGQALSTNPIDMQPEGEVSDDIKEQLLSQVVIKYKGKDGATKNMYSFTEAAKRGQIIVKNIKNGIRVQYTIGRENTKYLLPGWIVKEDLDEKILKPFKEYVDLIKEEYGEYSKVYENILYQYDKLVAYYAHHNPNADSGKTQASIDAILNAFYLDKKGNVKDGLWDEENKRYREIYTLDSDIQEPQKNLLESYIRTFAPDYGYDDLDEDHAKTEYVVEDVVTPLFKVAIEYTIDEKDGSLNIRVPANSIRFDETEFTLESISPLSYFGSADMNNEGYIFYPDGSGAIFDFADLYNEKEKINLSWSGSVYGSDFAYYDIARQTRSPIRMPVYGMVGTQIYRSTTDLENVTTEKTGYFAILEEGDALADITIESGSTKHKYASVYTTFYPRPKDTYSIDGATSEGGTNEWTVVSERKYTGSYRTKIIMLADDAVAQKMQNLGQMDTYYSSASWVGMAQAYRDYLENKGIITRFTNADVKSQIPLYIESFGSIETIQKILSMPVSVDTPLTTFEDIKVMYDDLASAGILNVNFKLTGFANGGMVSTYPSKVKWQSSVGGSSGFKDLIEYSKEKDFGVYPDFDFLYVAKDASFDGVKIKDIGAKTVDNKYTSRRTYNAVYQTINNYFELCVSANRIENYYPKFVSKYQKFEPTGISVGTLGGELNSNFDKDNPLNRNDSKEEILDLFARIEEDFGSVMTNGGNIYAVKYADHILEAPLDASNYRYAAASVPFYGMVLHGYKNFAGAPINESGSTDYNLLKTIENGATLYYLLSYRNASLMKQDDRWSEYYSIRFDIWFDEIVKQYNDMNEALGDLQTSIIVDHQFLMGERIPNEGEILANDNKLSEAIYLAVANAINDARDDKLGEYREKLVLYQKLKTHNSTLKSLSRSKMNEYLKENFSEYSDEMLAEIVSVYTSGGDCNKFKMETGLKVGVLVDLEGLYASIEEFIGKELTELQKNEIYIVIADEITTIDIEETILEIINSDRIKAEKIALTREKMYQIDKMIVDGASEEELKATLGDIINYDIKEELLVDEATINEIAAVLADCIFHGDEDVIADTVEIDYNFNKTDSISTDKENYVSTDYTLNDERIVMVTYSDEAKNSPETKRVTFVLNYNIFDVRVNIDGVEYEIPSYQYVRIDNK